MFFRPDIRFRPKVKNILSVIHCPPGYIGLRCLSNLGGVQTPYLHAHRQACRLAHKFGRGKKISREIVEVRQFKGDFRKVLVPICGTLLCRACALRFTVKDLRPHFYKLRKKYERKFKRFVHNKKTLCA